MINQELKQKEEEKEEVKRTHEAKMCTGIQAGKEQQPRSHHYVVVVICVIENEPSSNQLL